MFRKPFVYFSEAVITPTKSTCIIASAAAEHGGTPVLPVRDLWARAALSVRRQAALYRQPGYKGEAWHHWLSATVDLVADGMSFESDAKRGPFKAALMQYLGKPASYFVPDDVRQFIDLLAEREIGWGIIANENYLYQAILKYLRLSPPGPVVAAAGPTMFKPLPIMWSRAVARAPARSRHDVWFIGSVLHPCDNMACNDAIRCALLAPELAEPDPVSRHFRITSLADLERPLFGSWDVCIPDFASISDIDGAPELTPVDSVDPDVLLRASQAPLPAREGQEPSLADFKKSILDNKNK